MAEQRNLELKMNAGDFSEIAKTTTYPKLQAAIGYLSLWNMTFPAVRIYRDGENDLTAVYLRENGDTGYVIGAIWNETDQRYSFHS